MADAASLKAEGNAAFSAGDYKTAIAKFTEVRPSRFPRRSRAIGAIAPAAACCGGYVRISFGAERGRSRHSPTAACQMAAPLAMSPAKLPEQAVAGVPRARSAARVYPLGAHAYVGVFGSAACGE